MLDEGMISRLFVKWAIGLWWTVLIKNFICVWLEKIYCTKKIKISTLNLTVLIFWCIVGA